MEGLHLYKGIPGLQTKSDKASDASCMEPVTKRIKDSKNGTLLKNK